MIDRYNRNIDYLRISITDRCNLRCKYCMPEGVDKMPMSQIMTYEEIVDVAKAAATLGISKIKITGGEPLVRKGCSSLVEMLKSIDGIEQVTITTNGLLLVEHLEELKRAGVDGINISLDTMDSVKYRQITGCNNHSKVLEAIAAAVDSGIKTKVNAVSLDFDGSYETQSDYVRLSADNRALIELAKDYPVDVRFIEMMPIGFGKDFPAVSHDKLKAALMKDFPNIKKDESRHGNGPAEYYYVEGFKGSVGLISAIHGKFCNDCNRIRLTSLGQLKSCLCFSDGAELLPILRSDNDKMKCSQLVEAIEKVILQKPAQHCFEIPDEVTESRNMMSIGG